MHQRRDRPTEERREDLKEEVWVERMGTQRRFSRAVDFASAADAVECRTVPGYSHLFSLGLAPGNQHSTFDTGAPAHMLTNTHTHTCTHTDGVILTITFHPLVDEPVQQGPTVVTEGRAAVRVNLELMLASGVLGNKDSAVRHTTNGGLEIQV